MKPQTVLTLALALAVFLGLVAWLLMTDQQLDTLPTVASAPLPAVEPARPTAPGDAPARAPLPAADQPRGPERIDAETRARLLREIAERLAERAQAQRGDDPARPEQGEASAATAHLPPDELPPAKLDKEYSQARVREIVPLVKECYDLAMSEHPGIEGKVVVDFTIQGDDELGGVISDSRLKDPDAEQRYPVLAECVRETMYAIRIDPPEGGGVVRVTYPFIFRQAEE